MALGDLQGRARTNARNPQAKGECQRCTFWYPLSALRRQFEYRGAGLADTGLLVCPSCLDVPQEQLRSIILPGDPQPRSNPRPSPDVTGYAIPGNIAVPTSPMNQGFSVYVLNASVPGLYPTDKPDVLADVAALSGVPTPATTDYSTTIAAASASQLLMAAQPARTWLCLYNPAGPPVQIALGTAAYWGALLNLPLGPGEALFWATAQGIGTVYQGAVSIVGLTPGMPLWAWEA